jgi:hypothetical protein
MRLLLAFMLSVLPCAAVAQVQPAGGDRAFPAPFAAILEKLTKAQAENCTLMQSSAIASVDTALFSLDHDTPTKYRPDQVKKCWALYRALGSRDVENLDHCFADIQYFELLQRVAGPSAKTERPSASSYCDRVAQAAGGSYMILEECVKQENASRRRLGR